MAATQSGIRTHRTEARLRADQKECIERAAQLKGVSISDFIVQHAFEAARKTIAEHESWTLTQQDVSLFVKALMNPPKPNAKLKAASARYRVWLGNK